jgi:hypothetical protein
MFCVGIDIAKDNYIINERYEKAKQLQEAARNSFGAKLAKDLLVDCVILFMDVV